MPTSQGAARARAAGRLFIAPHEQDEHAREDHLEVEEEVDRVLEVVVLAHLVLIDHLLRVVRDVQREEPEAAVPVSGLGRRSAALEGPLEGWWVASKRLGPLPRMKGSALAHGCGRGGRVVLPLARAAAVSTG